VQSCSLLVTLHLCPRFFAPLEPQTPGQTLYGYRPTYIPEESLRRFWTAVVSARSKPIEAGNRTPDPARGAYHHVVSCVKGPVRAHLLGHSGRSRYMGGLVNMTITEEMTAFDTSTDLDLTTAVQWSVGTWSLEGDLLAYRNYDCKGVLMMDRRDSRGQQSRISHPLEIRIMAYKFI